MDKIHNMFSNLYYGAVYSITFLDSNGVEGGFDLWLDKADTAYCLQTIFMLDGVAEEVGDTTRHNKLEIMKKLTSYLLTNNFPFWKEVKFPLDSLRRRYI